MKAKHLLTGLVVFALFSATQTNGQVQSSIFKRHQGVRAVQNADPVNKTANSSIISLSSRLVGMNFRTFNGAYYESVDSFAFTFSGTRGGDLNSEYLLFDNGEMYRYDPGTGTYYDLERATQTFDVNNNPIVQFYQAWDTASRTWKNEGRYLNSFDSRNNILASIYQTWDISTSNWRNIDQYIYTYNSDNRQLTEIFQVWNNSGSGWWTNINKYTDVYDANKNMLNQLYQNWDESNQVWVNNSRVLSTFDASNRMLTYKSQTWNPTLINWENENLYIYTYDVFGDETMGLYQTWDATNSLWVNYGRHSYTYDSGITTSMKNLLSDHYEIWDTAWEHVANATYTYNSNNDRVTETDQVWDNTLSTWRYTSFFSSDYDNRHNQLSRLAQVWSNTESNFVNASMIERSFNNEDQLSSLITNTWNPGGFWQPTSNDRQQNFYYQKYGWVAVKSEQSQGTMSIYPCPATDFVNIDLAWNSSQPTVVSVFDVVGKLYTQWEVSNTDRYHTSLAVSNFPAGTYFMSIKGERNQMVRQFMVLHQ